MLLTDASNTAVGAVLQQYVQNGESAVEVASFPGVSQLFSLAGKVR